MNMCGRNADIRRLETCDDRRVPAVTLPPLRSARPPSITRVGHWVVCFRNTDSFFFETIEHAVSHSFYGDAFRCRRAFRWRVQVKQLKPATLYSISATCSTYTDLYTDLSCLQMNFEFLFSCFLLPIGHAVNTHVSLHTRVHVACQK